MDSDRYHIAERFESIQGEGWWIGTWMKFIRVAGCPVGRESAICTAEPSGFTFPCDTDYSVAETLTLSDLVAWAKGTDRVCITGGEPFVYPLLPLIDGLLAGGAKMVHIETSGTIHIPDALLETKSVLRERIWLTVSPKVGVIWDQVESADEVKWLVHNRHPFNVESVLNRCRYLKHWVQPVWDDEYKLNLQYALELCKTYPNLRLSPQLHKLVGQP